MGIDKGLELSIPFCTDCIRFAKSNKWPALFREPNSLNRREGIVMLIQNVSYNSMVLLLDPSTMGEKTSLTFFISNLLAPQAYR